MPKMIDFESKILVLHELVKSSTSQPVIKNKENLTFTSNSSQTEKLLKSNEIEFDSYATDSYTIYLNKISDSWIVVLDEESLRIRINDFIKSEDGVFQKNIAVLLYQNKLLLYDLTTQITTIDGQKDDKNYLIENLCAYQKLVNKLKSEDFIDYFNVAKNLGVIYTATKGILKISFPTYPFKVSDDKSIKSLVEDVLRRNADDQFKVHFKNELFQLEKKENQTLIETIVFHLDSILQNADNNYQIQLKNYSFDKLKNDLQKEKEKYFSSLREILNKILSQTVGVPISIGASIFASYKVENVFVLGIILLAFAIYVFFAIHFQLIYRKDILEIEIDFKDDFKNISEKSGLQESEIKKERVKIERRIKSIKNTIIGFIVAISVLAILFVCFVANQVWFPKVEDKSKIINLKATNVTISVIDSTKQSKNKPILRK